MESNWKVSHLSIAVNDLIENFDRETWELSLKRICARYNLDVKVVKFVCGENCYLWTVVAVFDLFDSFAIFRKDVDVRIEMYSLELNEHVALKDSNWQSSRSLESCKTLELYCPPHLLDTMSAREKISYFTNLTNLYLFSRIDIDLEDLRCLKFLSRLYSTRLHYSVSTSAREQIVFLFLRELILFDCSAFSQSDLPKIIAQIFPNLETFCFDSIYKNFSTERDIWGKLPSHCVNLNISAYYLQCFSNNCSINNLKVDCTLFSDKFAEFILDSKRILRSISIAITMSNIQSDQFLAFCLDVLKRQSSLQLFSVILLSSERPEELRKSLSTWIVSNKEFLDSLENLKAFLFNQYYIVLRDTLNASDVDFMLYMDSNFEWMFRKQHAGLSNRSVPFSQMNWEHEFNSMA